MIDNRSAHVCASLFSLLSENVSFQLVAAVDLVFGAAKTLARDQPLRYRP